MIGRLFSWILTNAFQMYRLVLFIYVFIFVIKAWWVETRTWFILNGLWISRLRIHERWKWCSFTPTWTVLLEHVILKSLEKMLQFSFSKAAVISATFKVSLCFMLCGDKLRLETISACTSTWIHSKRRLLYIQPA